MAHPIGIKEEESLHGLNCPRCGGVVIIPEGVAIVRCPHCDMRSLVRGQRGLLRYQVPQLVNRDRAVDAFRKFLSWKIAIAFDAARQSQLGEAFLVHLPFWVIWGRAVGWAFGEEKVGSGDSSRYEPREIKITEEMRWNGAACDTGEFGVTRVPLTNQPLEPFVPETLHASGLVFEPVGSFSQARNRADKEFEDQVQQKARKLDRIAQVFVRFFRRRNGLVYYPMWVLRYLYRGRAFQVVVDGYSGKVLYGKAPGNTFYRAAVLVAGMALGAILAIDASAVAFGLFGGTDDDGACLGLLLIIVGAGLMLQAYQSFRYGEHYEYRLGKKPSLDKLLKPWETLTKSEEIKRWRNRSS